VARAAGGRTGFNAAALISTDASSVEQRRHGFWGLVVLSRGTQDEEIYAKRSGALELVEQRSLEPGDFYVLIPL
jgi:hypothetical protein